MTHLLRADFYRIRKSKLTLVMLILTVMVPLLISLLYLGIQGLMDLAESVGNSEEFNAGLEAGLSMGGEAVEITTVSSLFNMSTLLAGAFSLSDNLGLVLPIFAGLLVCGDLTGGTLRSKLISGNSRTSVYLSHAISSGVFSALMGLIYAAFTLLFGFLFFGYEEEVTGVVLTQFLRWLVLGILTFIFASTVSTFLALSTGSTGGTIIFTLLFCIGLQLAASLCAILASQEAFREFLYLIPVYGNMDGLGITWKHFGVSVVALCLFGALNTLLGLLLFRKKELK